METLRDEGRMWQRRRTMCENRREECLKFDIREIFIEACRKNDLEKVIMCCRSFGVDINTVSRYRGMVREATMSGLREAASNRSGHLDVIDWLLAQPGIDVNLVTGDSTALISACHAGNYRIVRQLVRTPGINLNWQNNAGYTAAHCAAINSASCVATLAEVAGIDWNVKDNKGRTPLFKALQHGNTALETILDNPSVNYLVRDNHGNTLAHAGSISNSPFFGLYRDQIIKGLQLLTSLEDIPWNEKNNAGYTPLTLALKNDIRDTAKVLLKCPWVDATIADNEGRTPEMFARFVQLSIVSCLY